MLFFKQRFFLVADFGRKVRKNTKFQLNISKFMPDRPKNTGTWGVNNTLVFLKNVLLVEHSEKTLSEP